MRTMANVFCCPPCGGMTPTLLSWFGGVYSLHLWSWKSGAATVILCEGYRGRVSAEGLTKQLLVKYAHSVHAQHVKHVGIAIAVYHNRKRNLYLNG